MESFPPRDEHNPYAAPQSSNVPERPAFGDLGDTPISEPNPAARVRYDVIGEAWGLFRQQMGTWLLIGLVAGIIFVAAYTVYVILFVFLEQPGRPGPMGRPEGLAMIVAQLGMTLVITFVISYLMAGMFRAALRQLRGQPIGVGDLFQVGDVLWPFFLASILITLATYAGMFLCVIPGLYVLARFSLAYPLIVDGRMSATRAMGLSWEALRGQVFHAFVFLFVVSLVAEIGLIACGVGLLFTVPLYFLSYAILYRDFFLWRPSEARSPWIEKPRLDPEF